MKRVSLFLLVLLLSNTGYAQSAEDGENYCRKLSRFSSSVMELRQIGEPIADMMDSYIVPERPETHSVIKQIITDAYSQPLWPTQNSKERASTEFGNEKYLWCLKLLEDYINN